MALDVGLFAAEVAGIASMRGTVGQRAEALLAPLSRLTRFDAAFIAVIGAQHRCAVPLVRRGHTQRAERYLDSPAFLDDMELLGLGRNRRPMRVKDMPVPPSELPVWADYLEPAGFSEGVGFPLFTAEGVPLGYLSVQSGDPRPVEDDVCDLLAALAPVIAAAVDPMHTIAAMAQIVVDAVAGVVVTQTGDTVPVPGLPGHRVLAVGSPVLRTASTRLAHPVGHATFLCQDPGAADPVLRVTALACANQSPGHLRAIVLLSPPGNLHGLTRRELTVLGRLVHGESNARIGAALGIATGTVASHVEHIRAKLGASSRALASVRALRQGLYFPAALRGCHDSLSETDESHA